MVSLQWGIKFISYIVIYFAIGWNLSLENQPGRWGGL